MEEHQKKALEALKAELEFLQAGGYECSAPNWRPIYIFEDSPVFMSRCRADRRESCSDCVLMRFVPPEFRSEKFPCRHIPLNTTNETLDSLYRYNDLHEIKETVGTWLRSAIAELEKDQGSKPLSGNGHNTAQQEQAYARIPSQPVARCANPACPVLFDWHAGGKLGGKFFCFRMPADQMLQNDLDQVPIGTHGAKHFWLCEACSLSFTLVADGHKRILLRPHVVVASSADQHRSADGISESKLHDSSVLETK
jgi:hypothetical protein